MEKQVSRNITVSISEEQTITDLSKVIQQYDAEIYLKKVVRGTVYEINMKSFLGLVTLQLNNGDEIIVRGVGSDCEEAVEKVVEFLS
jgi:phosphocarrier protein HPr